MDNEVGGEATVFSGAQLAAFLGGGPHEHVSFESDYDGDLCALSRVPAEEAGSWSVTRIDEYSVRTPETGSTRGMFYRKGSSTRMYWDADGNPGDMLEFRIPDGTVFTVDGSRNLTSTMRDSPTLRSN